MFDKIEKTYISDICRQDDKSIKISFSLLMRLFEWCKEEAKNDVALHKVMEKIISFNDGINPLKMDTYDIIVADTKEEQECDGEYADNMDLDNAYNLGVQQAELGMDLSMKDYSDPGMLITAEKDNGYGASNKELEAFWNGYKEQEPLKNGCFTEYDMTDDINKVVEKMTLVVSPDGEISDGSEQETSQDSVDSNVESEIAELIKLAQG